MNFVSILRILPLVKVSWKQCLDLVNELRFPPTHLTTGCHPMSRFFMKSPQSQP